MSDIFKRIRSIEAEDDAVTKALGLTPAELEEPAKPEKKGRLNLSIPRDDALLDLDDLSLGTDHDTPDLNIPLPKQPEQAASKSRLGLTPILPLAKSPIQLQPVKSQPRAQSIAEDTPPRPASSSSGPSPLPDFMDNEAQQAPSPETIRRQVANKEPVAVSFIEHPKGANPYGEAGLLETKSPMARFITIAGIITAIIWIMCAGLLLAEMLQTTGAWASMSAVQKLGFSFTALFPLALIGLTTYAFRHLTALTRASDKLKVTAEALLTPDDTVIARSTIMAKSIQSQVDEVNLKVSSALTRMELLDDMVKSQGSSLAKSTIAIETTTSQIEDRISAQRQGLESIAGLFEGRMETLSHMMEGHTSQLASSGQMAEQRVQEARLSVESAAERIASASETVRQNAVAAAQTLSGSQIEITKLGDDVQAQSTRLDAVYRQHLNDLKTMLSDLRGQQDELAATMEERLSKMRDMSLSAKVGAESLTEASIKGRETVEALNEAASLTDTAVRARFSEMEEMVKYSTARAESISETAARQVQNSLSTTRKEIARIEADMMDLMDKLSSAEAAKATLAPPSQASIPALRQNQFSEPPYAAHSDNEPKYKPAPPQAPAEPALYSIRQPIENIAPPRPDGVSDLEIHEPDMDDLPAVLRRPSGDNNLRDRGKWSLRGLFSADEQTSASKQKSVSNGSIVNSLIALGLTPGAIVDDGCIIEASNLLKAKGASAMSEAVARRLGEPVRHLFLAIETDAVLKSDIQNFTAQFKSRLTPIQNDRETIRKRFESEAGRAYLLCDAALNS